MVLKLLCALALAGAARATRSGACQTITLVGQDVGQDDAELMGRYSLQYDVFDLRPVYLQNLTTTEGLSPAYLYYDSSSMAWKVGSQMGEGKAVYMYARSTATRPDFVDAAAGWKIFHKEDGKFTAAPSVKATCTDNIKHRAEAPKEPLAADVGSACVRWVATKGCDPDGAELPDKRKPCAEIVSDHDSGYCLCAAGRQVKFACGHSPFTCADKCKVSFPMVLAQSAERVWTNQIASNLVAPGGDWMTSNVKNQWVIFDLGMAHSMKSVTLMLWGSNANPKHCVLSQSTTGQFGPWAELGRFETDDARATIAKHVLTGRPKARFWRLGFSDNWGAAWGMGLNQVVFAYGEPGPTPAPAPDSCGSYSTCDDCVYKSMLKDEENCGWCGGSSTCSSGYPHQPSTGTCGKQWRWTSCSQVDPCSKFTNCSSCSARAECGWCDSDAQCKSGDCKRWGQRNCKFDMLGHKLQHLYAVAAGGSTEFWTPAVKGSAAGGGILAAAFGGMMLFSWKKRQARFRARLGEVKDGGSQYEMEDTNQYEDYNSGGGSYGSTVPAVDESAGLIGDGVVS